MIPELERSKLKPFQHQILGVEKLIENPFYFLADEMGVGKTKQVIDAACVMYERGIINRVLVLCPNPVLSVWYDPELGELAKHLWDDIPAAVYKYRRTVKRWTQGPVEAGKRHLIWMATNYDFIRNKDRQKELKAFCDQKTLLVLDESSAIKSMKALQTRAAFKLRKKCGRVVLLNGTPISNSPLDMYAQGEIMSSTILEVNAGWEFKARYALFKPQKFWKGNREVIVQQISGYQNLDDLQRRFAPYVLRRLKLDCLDLPPKLPPITLQAALDPKTWAIYKEMREELIAWLDANTVCAAPQAVVKIMRLAQICSGFLGGLHDPGLNEEDTTDVPDVPDFLRPGDLRGVNDHLPPEERVVSKTVIPMHPDHAGQKVRPISREKLDLLMEWLEERIEEDPKFKVIIWSRFQPEVQRLTTELAKLFPEENIGGIHGKSKGERRDHALRLLDPRTTPDSRVAVVGIQQTGSMGLNLTAAHTVVNLSHGYSLKDRLQSDDRVHRPGQTYPVSYFDVLATGPQGQRTVDHSILDRVRGKHELAIFTTSAWVKALREEIEE